MINISELYKKGSDRYYTRLNKARNSKAPTSWHLSGFGTCMISRYLKRKGLISPDQPIDLRLRGVFHLGNILEELFVNCLTEESKEGEYEIKTQGRVEDKLLGISGYYDAKLINAKTKEEHIVECKSKQSKAFWYMTKQNQGANHHHKLQLWGYLFLDKVKEGSIFYISKDDLCTLEYGVFRNDLNLKTEFMNELKVLNYCLENDMVPPLPVVGSWQEKYCDCHDLCKEFHEKEPSLFEADVKEILKDNEYLNYEV